MQPNSTTDSPPDSSQTPIFRDIRHYKCEHCGITRSKRYLIDNHIRDHHQTEDERECGGDDDEKEGQDGKNTCEECGKSFRKPAHLKQHLLSHSFERSFVCPVDDCQASYRRKDHLNRHMVKHEGKLFKCPVENCDTEFTLKSNIKRHLEDFHQGNRPTDTKEQKTYTCSEVGCGKEFKYASQLRSHAESHVEPSSSEAICADPDCMKPFANLKCLREHYLSCHQHVICEICGSKHLRKNIERHLRTHEDHPVETIKCSFEGCPRTFTKKSNLQQHINAVHLELKPYICSVAGCGMRFAFKHVRDNHEKSGRHAYAQGDLENFDEQFISRPRGGRKRQCPSIEMISRKRITPPNQNDPILHEASDYLSWLLSSDE